MPRNASGVYSLPESAFVAGTIIESAKVNSNYSDIATALTQSLATTGVSTMTGQLKAANGAVGAPSYTFAGSTTTGFYRSAADEISVAIAGVQKVVFAASGNVTFANNLSTLGGLTVVSSAAFASHVSVGGDISGVGNLFITGSASISFNLHVGATISAGSDVIIGGDLYLIGTARGEILASGTTTPFKVGDDLQVEGSASITGNFTAVGYYNGKLIAILVDQKTTGSAANSIASNTTAGSATTRDLNTEQYNYNSVVALASNAFTLPPGAWAIEWFAPVYAQVVSQIIGNQSILFNVSASSEVARGQSNNAIVGSDNTPGITYSNGMARVSVSNTATYDIRHQAETYAGTVLQGLPASLSTEVYTRVVIKGA